MAVEVGGERSYDERWINDVGQVRIQPSSNPPRLIYFSVTQDREILFVVECTRLVEDLCPLVLLHQNFGR
jgi:hypothetical protein